MTPSIFTDHDMEDGSNTYGVPRATFSLMAQCVDALFGFREVTLAGGKAISTAEAESEGYRLTGVLG
jgi:hypothetical protein